MKDLIKIIVMILIVIVVIFLGYFLFTKFTSKSANNKQEEKAVNVKKDVYELGDDIVFTKLKDVMFSSENDKRDFSKWKVLYQDRNYLVLYSVADWGSINVRNYYNAVLNHRKIMTQYKIFSGYDDDFRILGNKELELFSCNTYNMTCLNLPDWIGTSLTSINNSNGKRVVFNDNKIGEYNNDGEFLYHPVIRILKDKIE